MAGVQQLAQLLAAVEFFWPARLDTWRRDAEQQFLSATDGQPWLGDFGSSVRRGDARDKFTGGTPSLQIADDAPAARFDRAGIVVTFVAVLGLLEAGSRHVEPWPVATIRPAVASVDSGSASGTALAAALAALLEAVVGECQCARQRSKTARRCDEWLKGVQLLAPPSLRGLRGA
jgi:hypothetical protein